MRILDSGMRILDLGMRILDLGMRILDSGMRICDSGMRILDLGMRILDSGMRICDSGGFLACGRVLDKEKLDSKSLYSRKNFILLFPMRDLLFIITFGKMDFFEYQRLFVEFGGLVIALIFPGRDISKVGIVTLGFAFVGGTFFAEMTAAGFFAVEGIINH